MMIWPETLPENCPPDDARQRTVHVYLLVSIPIAPDDFLSLRQRYPEHSFPNSEIECQANGISVFENINHLQRVQRRVRRLRNRVIGVCRITPDMGVLKPTHSQFGNSHRTWWFPIGIKPSDHVEFFDKREDRV